MFELLKRKLRKNTNLCSIFNHYFGSLEGFRHNLESGNSQRTIENLLGIIYDLSEYKKPRADLASTKKSTPRTDASSVRMENSLSENIMTTITSANNKI